MGCASQLWVQLTLHCLSSFFKLLLLLNQDKRMIYLATETMHRTIWLPEDVRGSKGWKPRLHHTTQLPSFHSHLPAGPPRLPSCSQWCQPGRHHCGCSPLRFLTLLEEATLTCWLKWTVEKHLYFAMAFCQVTHYTCNIIPPYHNRVADAQTYLFVLRPHTLKLHFPKAVGMNLFKNPNSMVIAYVSPSASSATCFI